MVEIFSCHSGDVGCKEVESGKQTICHCNTMNCDPKVDGPLEAAEAYDREVELYGKLHTVCKYKVFVLMP